MPHRSMLLPHRSMTERGMTHRGMRAFLAFLGHDAKLAMM